MESYENQDQQYQDEYDQEDYEQQDPNQYQQDGDPQQYENEEEGQQEQQQDQYQQEPSDKNKHLWKQFGRETGVGKMLFSMYSAKEKPKVYYPPVKTKARQDPPPKEEKKCPQKAQIDYPEQPRKARKKYHPIDFVPKRKPGQEIIAEIEQEKNRPLQAPLKRGVDRKKLINDLQERFQFKNKAEIDAYMEEQRQKKLLPDVQGPQKKRKRKWNMGIAQKALQHYQDKYGKPPGDLLNVRPKTNEEIRFEQDEELEDLFDDIVEEIEERQEYLEKVVEMGGNKEIEGRVKKEIVNRIAELQKIREIQRKFEKL